MRATLRRASGFVGIGARYLVSFRAKPRNLVGQPIEYGLALVACHFDGRVAQSPAYDIADRRLANEPEGFRG